MTLVGAMGVNNNNNNAACKVLHNLSSCNPPIARQHFESLLVTLLDGQHIRQLSLNQVCRSSDSEVLTALQTVETVVRTQRHRLDADKFPMFSVG